MHHLFSAEGEAAIVAVMDLAPLLAFDFDGTLAPIVSRPKDARVPPGVARRLERLAAHLPLAIVSGRSVADVRALLPFEPRYVVGSHGAEDPQFAAPLDLAVLDTFRERLAATIGGLAEAGITVEDKRHSLALHYRLARDRARAIELIAGLVHGLEPALTAFGGKLVMNIVPTDAPDKGDAVASLAARSGARSAVFIGDDVNDEPVFVRAEPHWLTVKVGRDDATSKARFYVDSPADVAGMLDRLIARLPAAPAPERVPAAGRAPRVRGA